jgi:hypothetical protein
MECMIQFNVRNQHLQILITVTYGAIDDLYQKSMGFSKKMFKYGISSKADCNHPET